MSKFISKYASVRKAGDILKVKLETNGVIVFKGSAPLHDKSKVSDLFKLLREKGLAIPKDEDKSFWW